MSRTVILRADPRRVQVTIRAPRQGCDQWEAWVIPLPGGKMAPAFECDPQAAVEKALARAASIRMPGVDLDGVEYPHPQDPSSGRERVAP